MGQILNIACFVIAFTVCWKLFFNRFGIKQLSMLAISLATMNGLMYLCARFLGYGVYVKGADHQLATPEGAMLITSRIFYTALIFLPICYAFEWWYYKKHPDIDPYTGKKIDQKEEGEAEGEESLEELFRRKKDYKRGCPGSC